MKRLQEEELKLFVQKGSPRSNVRATISLWGTVALGGVVLVSKSVSVLPSHVFAHFCKTLLSIFQVRLLYIHPVGWLMSP